MPRARGTHCSTTCLPANRPSFALNRRTDAGLLQQKMACVRRMPDNLSKHGTARTPHDSQHYHQAAFSIFSSNSTALLQEVEAWGLHAARGTHSIANSRWRGVCLHWLSQAETNSALMHPCVCGDSSTVCHRPPTIEEQHTTNDLWKMVCLSKEKQTTHSDS
jgi:hypothetical protein